VKKAIIIGAGSGMGAELSKVLAREGYVVGMASRTIEHLFRLQSEISSKTYIKLTDVRRTEEAIILLDELIAEMGGMDLIVINAGVGFSNEDFDWEKEKETINVNVFGFAAVAGAAFKYFREQGRGHIVGISSIAGIRGSGDAPAYNASKSFISNYLEGLRQKANMAGCEIHITEILPGFVDTPLLRRNQAQGMKAYWIAPMDKAALQIYNAIAFKKRRAYITRRCRVMAWALKIIPGCIYDKLYL
jgi:short-subunit dehydrogenase